MRPDTCSCDAPILIGTTLSKKKVKLEPRPTLNGTWLFDVGINRIIQVAVGTYLTAYEEHRPYCLRARKKP